MSNNKSNLHSYNRNSHRWRCSTVEARKRRGAPLLTSIPQFFLTNVDLLLRPRAGWSTTPRFLTSCQKARGKSEGPFLVIEKIGDWKKLENLVQNQSSLKYCRCTTYCSTSQQRERQRSRNNDCMKIQPSSYSFTAPSCHCHFSSCSSSTPWNNYHHFSQFWDQLYGLFKLGLST